MPFRVRTRPNGDVYLLCNHCQEWKPEDDFPPNPKMNRGRNSWCRPCHVERTRQWRAEHREAINERRRAAYAKAKS